MARRDARTLRDKILDAAVELLREQGGAGLSQPRVAKRAGIPQGHLTYYFPRKADLLAAVARRFHDEIQREIAVLGMKALSGGASPAAVGVELLERLVRDDGRSRTLLGLLFASEDDPELRRSLQGIVDESRPALAFLLGVEPDDPTIDLALAVSWGLQVQQQLYRRSPRAVNQLVAALIERVVALRASAKSSPDSKTRTSSKSGSQSKKRGNR